MHCLINMDKSELSHSVLIRVINHKPCKIFSIFSKTFLPFHTLQLGKFLPFHIPEQATMENNPGGDKILYGFPAPLLATGLKKASVSRFLFSYLLVL